MQPQRNQTILQADTPAQKANYPYNRAHPTPLEADAHTLCLEPVYLGTNTTAVLDPCHAEVV